MLIVLWHNIYDTQTKRVRVVCGDLAARTERRCMAWRCRSSGSSLLHRQSARDA